ncbi:MAG: alpha/beta hydrolase-fold protein [Pedobacter sp.]|uniref:alpha/beta hydrolase-fold protein n=1 Tax=Pedobacter sp. TaxID=1411316 RepID=UPI00339A83E5
MMKNITLSIAMLFLVTGTVMAQKLSVMYPDTLLKQPFTGNILVYLSKTNSNPKSGIAGLDIFPCLRVYVKNVKAGVPVIIDDKAIAFPVALSDMERGEYYVQVVWDRNFGGRSIAESPGNLSAATQKINFTKDVSKIFTIQAGNILPETVFKDTQYAKEFKVPSVLLSKFHHGSKTISAAVLLPEKYYTEPRRKFPVRYEVSGYGGNYHRYSGYSKPAPLMDTTACIVVYLDGECALGHSVYANSDNNGPWGDALTKELIPAVEKTYRCDGARFLYGHSSGGWSVLWLQSHYPKVFDGCWSSSPDPVDFRSFERVNLYDHQNMFYGKDGSLNQTGTVDGVFPWFSMRNTYQMEKVIYRGEQMHSFDAVFSKKGADGQPLRICNDLTGEIDTTVFNHWKNYDISLYLRTNWNQLKGDLDGKVMVSVGTYDNFYLNHSVKLLDSEMQKLNSTFVFAYYNADHFLVELPENMKAGKEFLEKRHQLWLEKQDVIKN